MSFLHWRASLRVNFRLHSLFNCYKSLLGCAHSSGETPVPIPNTEVKPTSGDGTAVLTVGE